jgi:hypothetical protein
VEDAVGKISRRHFYFRLWNIEINMGMTLGHPHEMRRFNQEIEFGKRFTS